MGRGDRGLITLVLVAGWLASAQVGKVAPALPALINEFGLTMVQAGWVASAITSVAAICGVLSGLAVSVVGAAVGMLVGLGMLSLGSLMGMNADTADLLLASRLLEGLGFVIVVVTGPSLLTTILADNPIRRQRFLVIWGAYMPVGVALMIGAAPLVLSLGGWRALWFLNAFLACVVFLVAFCWRKKLVSANARGAISVTALAGNLRLPGPWLMGLCFGCYTAVWFMLVTWLPSFAVSEMGFSLYAAAWLTAIAVVFNIAGNLSAQFFSRIGVPRWMVLAGVQLVIGGFGWLVFSSGFSAWVRSTAAMLACGMAGALPATVFAGIPFHARKPDQVAVSNGIIMQCASLGSFAGPPAIAIVVTNLGGWDAGRWLIPLFAAIGFCAALILRGVEQRIAWRDDLQL
jgi:CP family cyanate transporter-like MFS transporter